MDVRLLYRAHARAWRAPGARLARAWRAPGARVSLDFSSKVSFFVGLGERTMPGSVVGCVGNVVKTTVSIIGFAISRV